MDKMSAKEKKNSRVSPCFLHLNILKEPFWATWSSDGVGINVVVVFIVVVIVAANLLSKEGGTMQKA
jgi:hypothetical protein